MGAPLNFLSAKRSYKKIFRNRINCIVKKQHRNTFCWLQGEQRLQAEKLQVWGEGKEKRGKKRWATFGHNWEKVWTRQWLSFPCKFLTCSDVKIMPLPHHLTTPRWAALPPCHSMPGNTAPWRQQGPGKGAVSGQTQIGVPFPSWGGYLCPFQSRSHGCWGMFIKC